MGSLLITSGYMGELVDRLSRNIKTTRGAELLIFLFSTVFSVFDQRYQYHSKYLRFSISKRSRTESKASSIQKS